MVVGLSGCAENAAERRAGLYENRNDSEFLRKMMQDQDRDVRATALNLLIQNDPPDAEALVLGALQDPEGFVRSIAAKLVGDLGNQANAPAVVEILVADPDPRARQTAARALEELGGEAAAAGLALGLDDPMKDVRLAAITGLRNLDPGRAKPTLARLLLEDAAWEIRVQAAGALGLTGDPAMIPLLENARDDESHQVQQAAANAIKRLGGTVAATGGDSIATDGSAGSNP